MESAKENQELKVLLINGSPHRNGNTFIALSEVAKALEAERIKTEIFPIGNRPIQGCIACYKCNKPGICVFKMNRILPFDKKQKKQMASSLVRLSISEAHQGHYALCSTGYSIPVDTLSNTSRLHPW